MKQLTSIKWVIIGAIIFNATLKVYAQQTYNTDESGNNIEHVSTESIQFLEGYKYTPTQTFTHHSYIDKTIPGQEEYTGGMTSEQDLDRTINTSLPVGYTEGSYSVTPFGSANYNIPIQLPPGTNGLIPELLLSYNSQNGNGDLGVGWSVEGLSAISRTGKTMYHDETIAPVQLDNTDKFALDGNRLVADLPSMYGLDGAVYKTELETYSKITQHGYVSGKGPEWFEVETKTGLIMQYGNSSDSKMLSDDGTAIMYWRINRITDVHGNYIKFIYKNDDRHSRIDKVVYTGNDLTGLLPYNTIQFYYETRDDNSIVYVGGSSLETKYLIKKIEIRGDGEMVRNYHFKYGFNKYSFLTEISESGKDGGTLNSTIFQYGDSPQEFQSVESNFISDNDNPIITGDYNGDGYFDVLELTTTDANFYLNDKDDGFSFLTINSIQNPVSVERIANTSGGDHINTTYNAIIGVADYLGMGKDNLLTAEINEQSGNYYVNGYSVSVLNNGSQFPVEYSTSYTNSYYTNSLSDFLHHGDFNGDGEMDFFAMLWLGSAEYIIFHFPKTDEQIILNTSSGALLNNADEIKIINYDGDQAQDILVRKGSTTNIYELGSNNNLVSLYSSQALLNNNYSSFPGDFNGDGKTDLLIKDNSNNWSIAYSTGNISYPSVSYFESHSFAFQNTVDVANHKIMVADYNGDGKSDILHAYMISPYNQPNPASVIKIYYSLGDNVFTTPNAINVSNDLDQETLMYGDFNGDGNVDYLRRPYNDALPVDFYYFNKDNKELLLQKVLNGFNQLTTFTYDYLTRENVYVKETDATYPLIDVQPPIAVITSVTVPDGVGGNNTTTYSYEGAKIHRKHKGFLGFHFVTANNDVNETKTQSEYEFIVYGTPKLDGSQYVGATPYIIEAYSTELGEELVSKITYDNRQRTISGGTRFFPYVDNVTTEYYKNTNIYSPTNYETFNYDYYGNLLNHSISYANGTGTKTTVNTYEQYNTWIPSHLKTSTVTQNKTGPGNQPIVKEVNYEYYTNGSLQEMNIYEGLAKEVTTEYEYDVYGNKAKKIISAQGLTSREASYKYDSKGRYIIETTNPLGQKSYTTHSHLWGVPLTQIDINGLTTTFQYDEFGSLISVITPDNITTSTVLAWDVGSGGTGTPTTVENSIFTKTVTTTGKPTIKTWYDEYTRERKTEKDGFTQKVYQVTGYDEKGNVATSTSPFYSGDDPVVTSYEYNWYNDVTLAQNPEQTTSYSYVYGLTLNQMDYPDYGTRYVTQTTVTMPDGKTKKTLVDASEDVIQVIDNNGVKMEYVYNGAHQLTKVYMGGEEVSSIVYDEYGNQTQLTDPNAGVTEYDYNAYGELIYQKDAKNNEYEMTYDVLGRIETKTENNNLTTNYSYYTSGNGINQTEEITYNGTAQHFTYDYLGRLTEKKETINSTDYTFHYEYDNLSRLQTIMYPTGFKTKHHYNSVSYPTTITNEQGTTTIWQAGTMNAFNQYTAFTLGNGLTTTKTYDDYGFLETIESSDPYVQDLKFGFDLETGNLNYRQDLTKGLTEEFAYNDNMNRLTQAKVNSVVQLNMVYQDNGNLSSKTDVGSYTYHQNKKNAMVRVSDPNNNISTNPQTITYNAFNSVSTITENNKELAFVYGVDQQRRKMEYKDNGTLERTIYYFGNYEKIVDANGDVTELHYIPGGDGLATIFVTETPNGQSSSSNYYYTHTDYLGSIVTLTDENANIVYEQNFDAWGRERNPANWTYTANTGNRPSWLIRGYTGHEHLREFKLINMNGRLYDPMVGRMLSPDNYVQDPFSSQGYNRYSYVVNNPLKYTDPSGEFLNFVFSAVVGGMFNWVAHGGQWNAEGFSHFIFGAAVGTITAGVGLGVSSSLSGASFSAGNVAILSGFSAGFVGGFVSTMTIGSSTDNALLGGLTSGIMGGMIGGMSVSGNSKAGLNEGFSPYRAIAGRPKSFSSDNLLASIGDEWWKIDFTTLELTVDLPTFELIETSSVLPTVQSLPGGGVYKYNMASFLPYESTGATNNITTNHGDASWLSRSLMGAEAGSAVMSTALNYGANAPTGKVYGKILEKELAAHDYFKSGARIFKYGGHLMGGINLYMSYKQNYQKDFGSFAYDVSMFGVGFIPTVGIPMSIVGTIYKDEVRNWVNSFPPYDRTNINYICFVEGTPVLGDSQYVNIEKLQKGDNVNSYNFHSKSSELKKIKYSNMKKIDNVYKIITTIDTFVVTSEHPFYVLNKEWVKAKDLKEEDQLKNYASKKIWVLEVEKLNGEYEVYNIEVEGNNNFYVGKGKVLVHNSSYISIDKLNKKVENE